MRLPSASEIETILRGSDQPLSVQCVWARGSMGNLTCAHSLDPIPMEEWRFAVRDVQLRDTNILDRSNLRSEIVQMQTLTLGDRLDLRRRKFLRLAYDMSWVQYEPERAPISRLSVANVLDLDALHRDLWDVFFTDPTGVDSGLLEVEAIGRLICLLAEVVLTRPVSALPGWARPRLRESLWLAASLVRPIQGRGHVLTRMRTGKMLEASMRGIAQLTLWEQRLVERLPWTEGLVLAEPTTVRGRVQAQRHRGDSSGWVDSREATVIPGH